MIVACSKVSGFFGVIESKQSLSNWH